MTIIRRTAAATHRRQASEARLYVPQLRAETAGHLTRLEGRAVPYNTWTAVGWYEESVNAGAFAKSISEAARALPLLLWHDHRSWPVGRAVEWREETDGLHGVWELDTSEDAQRAADMAARGHLTGLSIGFSPIRSEWELLDLDEWDPDNGALDRCTRIEARLHEVSLCATPAYETAGVTLVRSAESRVRRRALEGRDREPVKPKTPQLDDWKRWRSTL